jgi:hypothetical protein
MLQLSIQWHPASDGLLLPAKRRRNMLRSTNFLTARSLISLKARLTLSVDTSQVPQKFESLRMAPKRTTVLAILKFRRTKLQTSKLPAQNCSKTKLPELSTETKVFSLQNSV